MVRFLFVAFVATFVAAIAAVVGLPVMAQNLPAGAPPIAVPDADAGLPRPDGAAMRQRLMAMDTDHDGKFSKAEWLAGGRKERGFDIMDANHDGFITMDELKAGREKMRAMREAKGN